MTKFNPGSNLLLKGVVGSQAFGLAHERSDYDYQGIFVAPTEAFLGLSNTPQESYVFKNPDTTYHEVGKYCRLALKANPTVLDLMWLDNYNVRTQLGTELVNLRNNFLSYPYVRNAYLGYATSQMGKVDKRDDPDKVAKHARHLARLLHQGFELYSTGTYSVKLADPEYFIRLGKEAAKGNVEVVKNFVLSYIVKFGTAESVLPEKPNTEPVNAWLLKVRHEFYKYRHQDFAASMEERKRWPI